MTQFQILTAILSFWALLSMGTAIVGLYRPRSDKWRSFWFMSGMWGLIDGAIVVYAMIDNPPTDEALKGILKINLALDVCYLAAGIVLATRPKPHLKGFGLAILIQGLFLLALDAAIYFRIGG